MREKTLFVVTVGLQELPADGHFGRVVDVGTHAVVPLVALAELVEEHAVLLAARRRLDDRVDAPVLVGRDALPGHRVSASNQNPGLVLVLDVLLAVQVKLSRNNFGRRLFRGNIGNGGCLRCVRRLWFDSVELSTVVVNFVTNTLQRNRDVMVKTQNDFCTKNEAILIKELLELARKKFFDPA